jgi:hypothetical protein
VLPNALGILRQLTQSYARGFLVFALVGASGAVALFFVGKRGAGTFLEKGGVVFARPTVQISPVSTQAMHGRKPRRSLPSLVALCSTLLSIV